MSETISLTDEGIDQAQREIAKLLEISDHCRNTARQLENHRDAVTPHYGSRMNEAVQVHIDHMQGLADHYHDMAVMLAQTLEQYNIFDHALAGYFAQGE